MCTVGFESLSHRQLQACRESSRSFLGLLSRCPIFPWMVRDTWHWLDASGTCEKCGTLHQVWDSAIRRFWRVRAHRPPMCISGHHASARTCSTAMECCTWYGSLVVWQPVIATACGRRGLSWRRSWTESGLPELVSSQAALDLRRS